MNNFGDNVSFIWSVADLLRGPYRPNQYKDVMLPLTVLRRLDCVLEPTKEKVLAANKKWGAKGRGVLDAKLKNASGHSFYNTSRYTFEKLKGDPNNIAANLTNYIKGFSTRALGIIDHFGFEEQIAKLDKADRLFLIVSRFCGIDLHPDNISNIEMGYIFEELIRKFNEASNEEAGDHFTPREVVRLMVNLIFMPDEDVLTTKGIVKTLFDPACGTGGMLSVSEEYLRELNPDARLEAFGQDYNDQSFAVCGSDMMIKGQNIDHIAFGDSFTNDNFAGKQFDYMLANPPFGVEWKPEADFIKREHEEQGFGGRFGAGLPRINDGSLLFLLHMISKMKDPKDGGSRLAIVFNASPLFAGSAGSGESEIRRWIIENDWLEAIVALPAKLFYNTGINTYLWIVTNRKGKKRQGKIQLLDGTTFFQQMRKSLGEKRHEISYDQRNTLTKLYGDFLEGQYVRIFDIKDFGYQRITVERPLKLNFVITKDRLDRVREAKAFFNLGTSKKRKNTKAAEAEISAGQKMQKDILDALEPISSVGLVKNRTVFIDKLKEAFINAKVKVSATLFKAILSALSERDETADICVDNNGNQEPDQELRDYENVPLKETIEDFMTREILPHISDAWVDDSKTKLGYEIPFTRHFYSYTPPRQLAMIEKEIRELEENISGMLAEVLA